MKIKQCSHRVSDLQYETVLHHDLAQSSLHCHYHLPKTNKWVSLGHHNHYNFHRQSVYTVCYIASTSHIHYHYHRLFATARVCSSSSHLNLVSKPAYRIGLRLQLSLGQLLLRSLYTPLRLLAANCRVSVSTLASFYVPSSTGHHVFVRQDGFTNNILGISESLVRATCSSHLNLADFIGLLVRGSL